MVRRKGASPGPREAWEAAARAAIGERAEGGAVPLLSDAPAEPFAEALDGVGFPGEAPYTRGIQPTMYRGRLWTFRQYSGFGTAKETNRRYRYLLASGQTGLSVAFDLPTQIGYDSDHPRAKGEVGRCGVAITSVGDMRTLFDQIPLDTATVSMTINATAPILTALL
ncbi:MAG TPA: methylmalonyl-CoA mutase family protein, partial [Thermoplasmata archaeon]|nr:methylmalonyl-CoA mutase family protein [Thermoplasmata archaeon]